MSEVKGPYSVFKSDDWEIGASWFMINGPGIGDLRKTATTDIAEATVSGDIRNSAWREGRGSRDAIRRALEEAQQFVVDQIAEIGACDHSVGHCECEVIRLAENIKKALEADGEVGK